jgi:hypothetical protein
MSGVGLRQQFTKFAGAGRSEHFPDPFVDVATLAMPQSIRNALQWCEYIYMVNGTYRMAMERILSYFLTEIEIGGDVSDDEREKWEEFLRETLDAITALQSCMRDRMAYGNAFMSMLVPFKRFLVCPKCRNSWSLATVYNHNVFGFSWEGFKFVANCPSCKTGSGYRGEFKVDDKPDDEEKKLKIKRWNTHEIEMIHDPYTDEVDYLWRIPEDYKQQIRKGNLFHLERASMPVLEAIKHNQMFRFNPDVIFHMKEPTLAGIRNRGWGIPRLFTNFRQIWYVQVLHRYNEAIALDYVIPFRLLTPAPRGGASINQGQAIDPMAMFNQGDFRAQVSQMLRRRRRDPASWQMLPFPVQYQMLGGDANQLAPRDLLDQGLEQLLNDAGTPVELYKGSLQLQTAPAALRLFESTWHHLVHESNGFLQWVVRQTSQILSWEEVEASLKRVTIADDMQKQMAALQLMMGQQLSGTSGLAAIGYNWKDEQKRMADEAQTQAEIQARIQEEMEQAGYAQQIAKGQAAGGDPAAQGGDPAAQGGGAPPPTGGDPAAQGGMPTEGPVTSYIEQMSPNTPQTPQDMQAAAESIAQQMLGLPEGVKDSELRKLKQKNEVLHSLVRAKMDQMRQQARTQGGAMLMQQQGQQPPQ